MGGNPRPCRYRASFRPEGRRGGNPGDPCPGRTSTTPSTCCSVVTWSAPGCADSCHGPTWTLGSGTKINPVRYPDPYPDPDPDPDPDNEMGEQKKKKKKKGGNDSRWRRPA